MPVKLKYETGVAATVQFIALTILNFISGADSAIRQCVSGNGGCVSNIVLSVLYFMVITIWFGALWLAGYAAQDRRSKRICQLLIMAEGLVALIGLFEMTRTTTSLLGKLIALIELVTAVWISWLAFKIMRAKGGRIRTRRHPQSQS